VRIGKNALVGMGAVVLRDVEEETTVVGNPARILADRSSR
jgi:acetyltransferase-like isoleucine patch superfamily enzyme